MGIHDDGHPRLAARRRLLPGPISKGSDQIAGFVDTYFNAFNAARIREACQLLARAINDGATVGLSLSGALTPAGLGGVITPLMDHGSVHSVPSTGATPHQ